VRPLSISVCHGYNSTSFLLSNSFRKQRCHRWIAILSKNLLYFQARWKRSQTFPGPQSQASLLRVRLKMRCYPILSCWFLLATNSLVSSTTTIPTDPAYVVIPLTCSPGQSLYQLDIADRFGYLKLGWDLVNTCNATFVIQRPKGYLDCYEDLYIKQFCLEDN
jgi:hypothetical protein